MFLDTKADFFRRFKDASNLSDDLVQFREKIVSGENFNNLILTILCTIAGADGPINMKEAEVINLLLGVQKNDLVYNEFLKSISDTNVSITVEAIVDVAMQLGGIEQGKNYEPLNDPIVKCFKVLGDAVLLADGDVNQTELSCLSNFTAIAQSKAAEIARRIQSRTDADAPQYAPVANQTATRSQSAAIVSGDGGYHFEVVGE